VKSPGECQGWTEVWGEELRGNPFLGGCLRNSWPVDFVLESGRSGNWSQTFFSYQEAKGKGMLTSPPSCDLVHLGDELKEVNTT